MRPSYLPSTCPIPDRFDPELLARHFVQAPLTLFAGWSAADAALPQHPQLK